MARKPGQRTRVVAILDDVVTLRIVASCGHGPAFVHQSRLRRAQDWRRRTRNKPYPAQMNVPPPPPDRRPRRSVMRRTAIVGLMAIYSVGLFFLFDFVYSTFLFQAEAVPGIAHPVYHHGLKPNFDGYHRWGEQR